MESQDYRGRIGIKSVPPCPCTFLLHETQMTFLEVPTLSSKRFEINTIGAKARAITEISEMLKKEKPESLNETLDEIQRLLNVKEESIIGYSPMLSWEQIEKLKRSGYVCFGSHTCSHPILTKMAGGFLVREIELSKKILEEELKMPITGFSYPNGDHSLRVRQAVEKAGYHFGLTT